VIVTEGLCKVYSNKVRALDSLSIDIQKGDIVGFLGPNGAGKTTAIKILTNLIKPTSGRAYVMGEDVSRRPKEALRHIGCLVEVPGVYEYLTPNEMLTYLGKIRGVADLEQRVDEVLGDFALADWKDAKLASFSTGMQRRFAIAAAMLHNPDVLILDEPVLGLDPIGIRNVREIIQRLAKKEGKTVFLSSHLLFEVSEVCEKAILINRGQMVAYESVDKLRFGGTNRVRIEFVSEPNPSEVAAIETISGVTKITVTGTVGFLEFEGERGKMAEILEAIIGKYIRLMSFEPVMQSLEEVYMNLMPEGDSTGGVQQ
jgi:ABC-2 type transport system ATP-binding protein